MAEYKHIEEFLAARAKERGIEVGLDTKVVSRSIYYIDGTKFAEIKQIYESRPDGSLWLKSFFLLDEGICEECGKTFRIRRIDQRYCSIKCGSRVRGRRAYQRKKEVK